MMMSVCRCKLHLWPLPMHNKLLLLRLLLLVLAAQAQQVVVVVWRVLVELVQG